MQGNLYGVSDDDEKVHGEHVSRMVAFYSRTSRKYNAWHWDQKNRSCHDFAVGEILKTMKEVGGVSLLDVACGTGRATRAALDNGFDAMGLDIAPSLLEIAHQQLGIPRNRLIQGDATMLPFSENRCDCSCILGALHHTAQPHKIIAEMVRVTNKAIIVSDEANHLSGGLKHILTKLRLFKPVYRLLFRRPPRTYRRQQTSDTDGPTFDFSIEEIMPNLKSAFARFRCLTFYQVGPYQICSYNFPRLLAKQGVVVVNSKR